MRAARSHKATSTAEMAIATSPDRPALRTARDICCWAATGARASMPQTAGDNSSSTTATADVGAYVHPVPTLSPARTWTRTKVVLSHVKVPSASGESVGKVHAEAATDMTGTSGGEDGFPGSSLMVRAHASSSW